MSLILFLGLRFVFTGSIFGGVAYIAGLLMVAEFALEDGLRNFLTNTSSDYSLLGGILSGGTVSVFFTVSVSLCTNQIKNEEEVERVWYRTLSIDNPLNPWRKNYAEELEAIDVAEDTKVNTTHMAKIFRNIGMRRLSCITVTLGCVSKTFDLCKNN